MATEPDGPRCLAVAGKFYEHERYRVRARGLRGWVVPAVFVGALTLIAWLFSAGHF